MIVLSCRPSDSLDWDAKTFPKEGPLLWRFDLGLEDPFFAIDDEMHFESLSIALKKFAQEIWPLYHERTRGAILYRGSSDFSSAFCWSEKQRRNWDQWKQGRNFSGETHLRRLFCADAFTHYFQMLAHLLPDEMPLYILLDAVGVGSLAERHQLLSKERFEHFQVATKGLVHTNGLLWEGDEIMSPIERASEAVCLPGERMCEEAVLARLDAYMKQMDKPFRVISEAFLTEDWEGVDVLHVLKDTLTMQGMRKIKGFEATGGIINYY
jgi:hypothetical protein